MSENDSQQQEVVIENISSGSEQEDEHSVNQSSNITPEAIHLCDKILAKYHFEKIRLSEKG
jgi:hypothetical protein